MKNPVGHIKFLSLLFLSVFLASHVQSQEYTRDFSSNTRLNDINPQAFRHFKKNYQEVSNECWNKTGSGFTVKYSDHHITSQAFYDLRGGFMYNVKYVEEKDLDREIKYRILKSFPGYSIDVVSEVVSDINKVYLLSLKNKMMVKNVIVTETDCKVIEDILYASR